MTSSTLLADPPSNETIDVFYIKTHLREIDGGVDWIRLAQDRDRQLAVVNMVMGFRIV